MTASLDEVLFIGTHGDVAAINARTGMQLWRQSLGGMMSRGIVTLLMKDGVVYAGSTGKLYAINAATGQILWSNDLPGMGYGPICLAMQGAEAQSQSLNEFLAAVQQQQQQQAAHSSQVG